MTPEPLVFVVADFDDTFLASISPLPLICKCSVFTVPPAIVMFPDPLMVASRWLLLTTGSATLPDPLKRKERSFPDKGLNTVTFPEPLEPILVMDGDVTLIVICS